MPEIRLVHNLEHGAVILQYGDKVPAAQVQRITAWYQQDANAVVVAPLPKLGAQGRADRVDGLDRSAPASTLNGANAFRKAFRYHAPESGVSRRAPSSPASDAA